jgi:hypothetical protein
MVASSTIACGSVGPDLPSPEAGKPPALLLGEHRAHELGRGAEGRVVGGHHGLADQADHLPAGEGVLERLQQEVADHPLGLGPQHVERVGTRQVGVERALDGQHPDLGTVAVGDDQVVVVGQGCEGVHGHADVLLLGLGQGDLAPLEQGVAAHRHHQAHLSSRGWPPWPP